MRLSDGQTHGVVVCPTAGRIAESEMRNRSGPFGVKAPAVLALRAAGDVG
jgi:hypothetical protein